MYLLVESNSIRIKEAPNTTSINFLKRFAPWSYTLVEEVFLLQIKRKQCNFPVDCTFKIPSKFLNCSWRRDWIIFRTTTYRACCFQIEGILLLLTFDWWEKYFAIVLSHRTMCCQSNSSFWSRELFQPDVLVRICKIVRANNYSSQMCLYVFVNCCALILFAHVLFSFPRSEV